MAQGSGAEIYTGRAVHIGVIGKLAAQLPEGLQPRLGEKIELSKQRPEGNSHVTFPEQEAVAVLPVRIGPA